MCGIDVVASGRDEMGRGGQRWCRILRVSGGFKIWSTSVIYIFVCCGTQRCGSLVDATKNFSIPARGGVARVVPDDIYAQLTYYKVH